MAPLILNSSLINFCVYGLGTTGMSVINYFNRENFTDYRVWDDEEICRAFHSFDMEEKKGDYPGVCSSKDLSFYMFNCPDPNFLLKI